MAAGSSGRHGNGGPAVFRERETAADGRRDLREIMELLGEEGVGVRNAGGGEAMELLDVEGRVREDWRRRRVAAADDVTVSGRSSGIGVN